MTEEVMVLYHIQSELDSFFLTKISSYLFFNTFPENICAYVQISESHLMHLAKI